MLAAGTTVVSIGDLDQEIESVLFPYLSAKTDGDAAQVRRVPAMRLDFIFEEPRHSGCMFSGAAVFQDGAKLSGDDGGRGLRLSHGSVK